MQSNLKILLKKKIESSKRQNSRHENAISDHIEAFWGKNGSSKVIKSCTLDQNLSNKLISIRVGNINDFQENKKNACLAVDT